uniref:Uncharacterized protein n=1 Tax=viral metagenome TaxID=1070528 RepID=A0A6C0BDV3_9ZZZZ
MSNSNIITTITVDDHTDHINLNEFTIYLNELNEELDFLEKWDLKTFGASSNLVYQGVYKDRMTREFKS